MTETEVIDIDTKQVKDPVHGYISIPDGFVRQIVDTRLFQRLRDLRQLDTTRMVYPSANHSRFEHSLGVFHLGTTAFESLRGQGTFDGVEDTAKLKRTLQCACLLHDIGHFPYSHLGERFAERSSIMESLERETDLTNVFEEHGLDDVLASSDDVAAHELATCYIVLTEYYTAIEKLGADPYEVCAFVLGTSLEAIADDAWQWEVVAKLVHSPIDIDRLDYMLRDDHMAGASLVSVDSQRMVKAYTAVDQDLGLSDKAISTIRNYLDGRNAVYMWIAQHHKVVYSNGVIEKMIDELVDALENPFTIEKMIEYGLDDNYVAQKIRELALEEGLSPLEELYRRYRRRDYLASCWKHVVEYDREIQSDTLTQALLDDIDTGTGHFEGYLKDELELEDHEIVLAKAYVPGYDSEKLEEVRIDHGGNARRITRFGIYEDSDFFRSVPHVFVPEDETGNAVDLLNDYYN